MKYLRKYQGPLICLAIVVSGICLIMVAASLYLYSSYRIYIDTSARSTVQAQHSNYDPFPYLAHLSNCSECADIMPYVNIWENPGISKLSGQAPWGAEVLVLGAQDHEGVLFYHIRYGATVGYVTHRLVEP